MTDESGTNKAKQMKTDEQIEKAANEYAPYLDARKDYTADNQSQTIARESFKDGAKWMQLNLPATGSNVVGENRWISVKTKLPKEGERVLCFTESGNMKVGYTLHNEWCIDGVGVSFYDMGYIIKFWQPLPAPPRP